MKSYLDFAENDFLFLQSVDISNTYGFNTFCALSQKVCERYLKHIVDIFVQPTDIVAEKEKQDIIRTHSLRKLYNYLKVNVPQFNIAPTELYKADSYYFSVQYPGDQSFFATKEDVDACMEAVLACRQAVKVFTKNQGV